MSCGGLKNGASLWIPLHHHSTASPCTTAAWHHCSMIPRPCFLQTALSQQVRTGWTPRQTHFWETWDWTPFMNDWFRKFPAAVPTAQHSRTPAQPSLLHPGSHLDDILWPVLAPSGTFSVSSHTSFCIDVCFLLDTDLHMDQLLNPF